MFKLIIVFLLFILFFNKIHNYNFDFKMLYYFLYNFEDGKKKHFKKID